MSRRRSRLTPGSSSSTAALQNMVDTLDIMGSDSTNAETNDNDHMQGADVNVTTDVQTTQNMDLESQKHFDTSSQSQGKGKSRLVENSKEETRLFPFMELPTEIRLEIYRACLTRPYNILLSRVEHNPPKPAEPAAEDESQAEVNTYGLAEDELDLADVANQRTRRALQGSSQLSSVNHSSIGSANNPMPVAQTTRPIRSTSSTSATRLPAVAGSSNARARPVIRTTQDITRGAAGHSRRNRHPVPRTQSNDDSSFKGKDPLTINILRTSKQVYKEARGILYSENIFDLDVNTAVISLAALHQRSRRHIKHVELVIPTYTEIVDQFSVIVRLSLRYCTSLKKFVIHTPFTLPGTDGGMSSGSNSVYTNGFEILRWLPQQCQVVLEGNYNAEIDAVVNKHLSLAKTQDKDQYYTFEPWLRIPFGSASTLEQCVGP